MSDAPEVREHHDAGQHETHHEAHAHPELTEEEAAALAEHIADAQDDDAARDAQNRVFAAADAAADAGVHEDHGDLATRHDRTSTRAKNTRKIPRTRSLSRRKPPPKKKA